jgi:uncharacterized protein
MTIIQATEEFVKQALASNDTSHDFHHIERVVRNANHIAEQEGVVCPEQKEMICLAALLHDISDYKYGGSDYECALAIRNFLSIHQYPEEKIAKIIFIVNSMSYRKELDIKDRKEDDSLLAIVQDADRLDAMGAIGIGRCFAFSGAKGRSMHNPTASVQQTLTQDQYTNKSKEDNTSINHFYDKLFRLKDLMKTETGKQMAEQRHEVMQQFVNDFLSEWNCAYTLTK